MWAIPLALAFFGHFPSWKVGLFAASGNSNPTCLFRPLTPPALLTVRPFSAALTLFTRRPPFQATVFFPSTHGAPSPAITQRVEPTAEKMYGASAETSRVRRRQAGRAQRVLGKDRQGRSADCLAASGHSMIVLSCALEMEEWPASEPH